MVFVLHGATGSYKGLQGVTGRGGGGKKGLQGATMVTAGYMVLQEVARGFRGFHRVTRGYRG